MTTFKKEYTLSKGKQLVDLNGDSTNFDITFKVVSKNHVPFDLLVVDQTTLDNTPSLQYKRADKGEISGNIVQNKNVYQNYFLILRADEPCEVEVEVIKKDLPKTAIQLPDLPKQQIRDSIIKQDGFDWMKLLLIVGVISVIGAMLYWYSKRTDTDQKMLNPPQASIQPATTNPLIERLKNLNLS